MRGRHITIFTKPENTEEYLTIQEEWVLISGGRATQPKNYHGAEAFLQERVVCSKGQVLNTVCLVRSGSIVSSQWMDQPISAMRRMGRAGPVQIPRQQEYTVSSFQEEL